MADKQRAVLGCSFIKEEVISELTDPDGYFKHADYTKGREPQSFNAM